MKPARRALGRSEFSLSLSAAWASVSLVGSLSPTVPSGQRSGLLHFLGLSRFLFIPFFFSSEDPFGCIRPFFVRVCFFCLSPFLVVIFVAIFFLLFLPIARRWYMVAIP